MLRQFQHPTIYTKSQVDFKILKNTLPELFPKKFTDEARQYINVYPNYNGMGTTAFLAFPKSVHEVCKLSIRFESYPAKPLKFEKETQARMTLSDRGCLENHVFGQDDYTSIVEEIPQYLKEILVKQFKKSNSKLIMKERIKDAEIFIESRENGSVLQCGDYEIKIISRGYKIFGLPTFFPADFGINCPLQLPKRSGKNEKLVILHADDTDFEIAETNLPKDLKRNVALLMIDEEELASPITILGICKGRFKIQEKWADPQFFQRKWVGDTQNTPENTDQIKFLTYNTLTSTLASTHTEGWPHLANKPEIEHAYRQQMIYSEIEHYDADVIGIQEAETEMIPASYNMIQTQVSTEKNKMPNLVIAWKPEKYHLKDWKIVKYQDLASAQEKDVLEEKKHMFIVGFFECKSSGKEFVFANTHLYYKEDEIKKLQLKLLCETVKSFCLDDFNKIDESIPLIVSGDMNMDISKDITVFNHGYNIAKSDAGYTTKLKFCPEHAIIDNKGEPDWSITLDGLFFMNCEQNGYLSSVSDDYVREWDYMPSRMFSSDHLAQGYSLVM